MWYANKTYPLFRALCHLDKVMLPHPVKIKALSAGIAEVMFVLMLRNDYSVG